MLGRSRPKYREGALLNLVVCQPPMLPFISNDFTRRLNNYSVISKVRKNISAMGMSAPILVTTVPTVCDYFGSLGEQYKVYYCVDRFSLWPGINSQIIKRYEEQLIAESDMILAASRSLYKDMKNFNKNVHLFEHGVDLFHFSRPSPKIHNCLSDIKPPRVGYIGLFDERSDLRLIESIARKLPDISFVITGSVETDISGLKKYHNVHFTGKIDYQELPELINGLSALILPYRHDELGNSIAPLKLKEYLATGKPVIGTPINAVIDYRKHVLIGKSPEEWEAHLSDVINERNKKNNCNLIKTLKKDSWEEKAKKFVNLLELVSKPI
jgi:glycosyltransferase involved in cell wall biosynthesis